MFWVKTPALLGQVFQDAWWKISNPSNSIFLTFDDGPHPETTPFILEVMKKHNAKASFFCTGQAVEDYPQLFRQMKEEGHLVGNHSYSHLHSWKTDSDLFLKDISRADAVIGSKYFRPPYGKLTRAQWLALKQQYQIVMWSVMPHDYKTHIPSEKILERLKEHSSAGDIVVLHENDKSKNHIKNILPSYLQFLKEKALQINHLPYVD